MESEKVKPVCKVIGEDGNIFNIMGQVRRCLKKAGESDEKIKEILSKITRCGSYSEALNVISEYVELI